MLKIENCQVFGWEAAIRGMRNPKNSWDKSDSVFDYPDCFSCPHCGDDASCELTGCTVVGDNDLKLMQTLSDAGNDHGKFLRMIHVQVDVTAPLYWWKETDQYKVGTVTDSCSTMHKIHAKEFTLEDFSYEHLIHYIKDGELCDSWLMNLEATVDALNLARELYLESKDKTYWWQMIQLLPSSYNQKRTWDLNYAVLKNIYNARKNHKLDEWHTLCEWIETLPYAKELIIGE